MLKRHQETVRFYVPILALVALMVRSTWFLVHAHLDPSVHAPHYTFERPLQAVRGSIYASDGKDGKGAPLVRSVPFWEYCLDPVALTNAVVRRKREPKRPKEAILRTISNALKFDYAQLKQMSLNVRSRNQFLKRSSDQDVHDCLADSSLVAGIAIHDRQVRQYLCGKMLSHVLGSVNAEGVGSCGIEQRFNRELTGTPGVIRGMKDARGRELYDKRIISTEPIPGADIYLTIDPNIQAEAEDALKWGIKEYGAAYGLAIVMDAETGAIYAMTSAPDFDPLMFGRATDEAKINRAVAFNFEPGSVMKVVTTAIAIDTFPRRFGPSTVYRTNRDDNNYYKLPGDGSHVWDPTMNLTHAIVHSSNIVIGKLAYDVGPLALYDGMRRFGLGQMTGIELPGEQFGILPDPRKRMWDKASWSRAGIGQFLAVTPIQLISAYQAIANDGVRMKPHIVKRIVRERKGGEEVIYQHEDQVASRPISAKTAKTLREMMTGVATREGTARRAAIRGYSIAGKTGTAQKAGSRGYVPGVYRASFCGIVPATAPKYVVLVTLDFNTNTRFHQGGNSAAPVFKRIAVAANRFLNVSPDKPNDLEESEDEDEYDKILDEREEKYGIIEL